MDILTLIDEKEWSAITTLASVINLKKDELIFRKGERSNKEVFLENGIVRAFIVDEDGNEKSTAFFQQGEFMSTQSLRTLGGVSRYSYQALCPTKLLFFDSKQLKDVLSETQKLIALGKNIKERELIRLDNRDDCLMQARAADRYMKFVTFYPRLEGQISQRYIASYLGITPVSLSRLKKTMIAKTVIN